MHYLKIDISDVYYYKSYEIKMNIKNIWKKYT